MSENERFPVVFNYGEKVDGGKLMEDLKFLLNREIEVTTNIRHICVPSFSTAETVMIMDGTAFFVIPKEMNGYTLTDALSAVYVPATADTDIQLRLSRVGVDIDLLTTELTILATEYNGKVDTINKRVQEGDIIFIDVDDTSGDALGLSTTLTFEE